MKRSFKRLLVLSLVGGTLVPCARIGAEEARFLPWEDKRWDVNTPSAQAAPGGGGFAQGGQGAAMSGSGASAAPGTTPPGALEAPGMLPPGHAGLRRDSDAATNPNPTSFNDLSEGYLWTQENLTPSPAQFRPAAPRQPPRFKEVDPRYQRDFASEFDAQAQQWYGRDGAGQAQGREPSPQEVPPGRDVQGAGYAPQPMRDWRQEFPHPAEMDKLYRLPEEYGAESAPTWNRPLPGHWSRPQEPGSWPEAPAHSPWTTPPGSVNGADPAAAARTWGAPPDAGEPSPWQGDARAPAPREGWGAAPSSAPPPSSGGGSGWMGSGSYGGGVVDPSDRKDFFPTPDRIPLPR
ncbi:MAG: hypothetical protein H7831_13825 [Magnetococcus sp. WYHC-3]